MPTTMIIHNCYEFFAAISTGSNLHHCFSQFQLQSVTVVKLDIKLSDYGKTNLRPVPAMQRYI